MKKCSCCGKFYTMAEWEDLEFVGSTPQIDEYGNEKKYVFLEFRNCKWCGSTITLEIDEADEKTPIVPYYMPLGD